VGRERELALLPALIMASRLVTITGPGGAGKTRLAMEVADRMARRPGDDVRMVELAGLRDPALLPAAIAGALGLRADGSAAIDRITRSLAGAAMLLVLDNLEQLHEAGPLLADLLAACPGLRILATSRVPLNISAERLVTIGPLAVPPRGATPPEIAASPSVALFLERARAVQPSFTLDAAIASRVAEICRRLDGLPLALELAAARLRLLPPSELLARLEHPLGVLVGGPVDTPERHRTLRDTIAWSVSLLPPDAARLFPRLGVFAGGFDLAAALAVAPAGCAASEAEMLRILGVLVDHSLLRVTTDGESAGRFGMLETIREHALESLQDEPAARQRHLEHYLALAEACDTEARGVGDEGWSRRLTDETENCRAALAWARSTGLTEIELRLCAALAPFWRHHGDLHESRDRLRAAIATAKPCDQQGIAYARSLFGLTLMEVAVGDREAGREACERSLKAAAVIGDRSTEADALLALGMIECEDGRLDRATELIERSANLGRELDDMVIVCRAMGWLASMAQIRGDLELADRYFTEAILGGRRVGDAVIVGIGEINLGLVNVIREHPERALGLLTSGLIQLKGVRADAYLPFATAALALAQGRAGRPRAARDSIGHAADLARATAAPTDLVYVLEVAAEWLGAAGQTQDAMAAWSAAELHRERLRIPVQPRDRWWVEPAKARDHRASVAVGTGFALDDTQVTADIPALERALEDALTAVRATPLRASGTDEHRDLTARELEVLALVGAGCSDGEIAQRLFISKKTASVHVANIKGKLGTANRVETALAARRVRPPTDRS
jgi:predicted ATPase/DNA-binding CsgD family transcriptional regulator